MQFIVSLRKYCDIFEYELSRIILYDHLVYDKKFLIFEILLEVRMEFRKKSTLYANVLDIGFILFVFGRFIDTSKSYKTRHAIA